MFDPPATPLLQGTWAEVLSHKDDIPLGQRVKILPDDKTHAKREELESQNLLKTLDDVLAEIDAMDFEPATEPPSPFGEAVIEKYRKQGWYK